MIKKIATLLLLSAVLGGCATTTTISSGSFSRITSENEFRSLYADKKMLGKEAGVVLTTDNKITGYWLVSGRIPLSGT